MLESPPHSGIRQDTDGAVTGKGSLTARCRTTILNAVETLHATFLRQNSKKRGRLSQNSLECICYWGFSALLMRGQDYFPESFSDSTWARDLLCVTI
jgi:hypothetical protein